MSQRTQNPPKKGGLSSLFAATIVVAAVAFAAVVIGGSMYLDWSLPIPDVLQSAPAIQVEAPLQPATIEVVGGSQAIPEMPALAPLGSVPVQVEAVEPAPAVVEAVVSEPMAPYVLPEPVRNENPDPANLGVVVVEHPETGQLVGELQGFEDTGVYVDPSSAVQYTTANETTITVFDPPPPVDPAPVATLPPPRTAVSIDGRVEDIDGNPVFGAKVTLGGVTQTTDPDGRFRFEEAPDGTPYLTLSVVFRQLASGTCLVGGTEYAVPGSTSYMTLKPGSCP